MSTVITRLERACGDYLAAAVNHPNILIEKPLAAGDFPRGIDRYWESICSLSATGRTMTPDNIVAELDRLNLSSIFREDDMPEDVFLNDLFLRTPSWADGCFAADRVSDLSCQAALIYAADKIGRIAGKDDQSAVEKLAGIEEALTKATDKADPSEVEQFADSMLGLLDTLRRTQAGLIPPGIQTPFFELNAITKGFRGGQLIIVAGRPGMGKTGLKSAFAFCAARADIPTYFLTMEMATEELNARWVATECKLSVQDQFEPNAKLKSKLAEIGDFCEEMKSLPLYLEYAASLFISQVCARVERAVRRYGVKLVLIDYLQLIKAQGFNREQEVAKVATELKALAGRLGITIVAGAQINRLSEQHVGDRRPNLGNLRESGAIEQFADTVIMLHREEYYDPNTEPGVAELLVRKQRNGKTGVVRIGFEGEFTRFSDDIPSSMPDYKGPSPFEGPQSPPPKRTIGDLFKKV